MSNDSSNEQVWGFTRFGRVPAIWHRLDVFHATPDHRATRTICGRDAATFVANAQRLVGYVVPNSRCRACERLYLMRLNDMPTLYREWPDGLN